MILLMEKEKELEVSLTTVGLVDGGGAVGVKRKSWKYVSFTHIFAPRLWKEMKQKIKMIKDTE